jgi:SAM-dependent MidA family methyltransferase
LLLDLIAARIQERGPLTVAAFMDLALYHPAFGYYTRVARRSGRTGDFVTSVDVGPLFGDLLGRQVIEMAHILAGGASPSGTFDLVEAGASNGRLAADMMSALRAACPSLYERTALHLVEVSPTARAAQRATLESGHHRLASSTANLPPRFEGVLVANELLDAMPVHQVVMRKTGLAEVYVDADRHGLRTVVGRLSTPDLDAYLQRAGVVLQAGGIAEIGLRAAAWARMAARSLARGFMILIDYGHEARHLYSAAHASGTLTSCHRQVPSPGEGPRPVWLERPGEQDITAHVDFSSLRRTAVEEGLTSLGLLDQTYFLMGVLGLSGSLHSSPSSSPSVPNLSSFAGPSNQGMRLALKTLLLPGGLGSTMKVLILGKGVGRPALLGCSGRMRVT